MATSSIKLEPHTPTSDLNNNLYSPEKLATSSCISPLSAAVSPVSSVKGSPRNAESDCDDIKEEIDSDEEVTVKGKRPPGAVRRRNERERNRVKHINRTFSVLRQHLPTRKANKKLSKVETLRSAVDYIKHLRQLLADHDSLTAAISLEQALIAHNHQQQVLHQQLRQQPQFPRFPGEHSMCAGNISAHYPQRLSTSSVSLNSSLCSPTGPVHSPSLHSHSVHSPSIHSPPFSGPSALSSPNCTQHQDSSWDQTSQNDDSDILDLAAEAAIADIDLW